MTLALHEDYELNPWLIDNDWMPPAEPADTLMPLRPTVEALRSQPETVVAALNANEHVVDELAQTCVQKGIDRCLAVGSGDSLRVAEATVLAFERFAGIPTRAVNALTYSARGDRFENEQTLKFAISATGRNSEATDALAALRTKPGLRVLLSDAPASSPYGDPQPEEISLRTHARRAEPHIPSVTTLSAQALALDAALAIGKRRGHIHPRLEDNLRNDVLRNPMWMSNLSRHAAVWARDIVAQIPDCNAVAILGEGSDYVAAKMGDSLMAGGPQIFSMCHELAEHDHAFRLQPIKPGQPVILLAIEGLTPYHVTLYQELQRTGKFPILIAETYSMYQGHSADLLAQPDVFPAINIPHFMNLMGSGIILQWLSVAMAARRVEEGYERITSTHVMSDEVRQQHINYWTGKLVRYTVSG